MRVLGTALPALLLAAALGRAAFGPPPSRAFGSLLILPIALLAVAADVAAAAVMLGGDGDPTWTAFVGGAAGSVAVWLARGRGPGPDDDDPPDDEPDTGPEPIDWDAFDHARASWRPRQPA